MSSVAKQVSSNTNKILGALHLYYNNKLETGHQVGAEAFLITVTAMSLNFIDDELQQNHVLLDKAQTIEPELQLQQPEINYNWCV